MPLHLIEAGMSRSFPYGFPVSSADEDIMVILGGDAGRAYARAAADALAGGICALELEHECLAVHTGLKADARHRRTVGFARFRMGDAEPTPLVEIVRQPWTDPEAVSAVRRLFEGLGLKAVVCEDSPGRIVDRLIRPYLNAVLRRHDQKLASAEALDKTLCLGLGYPEGPLALLDRTGLHHHHDATQALYRALGDPDFAPARAAQVAKARQGVTG